MKATNLTSALMILFIPCISNGEDFVWHRNASLINYQSAPEACQKGYTFSTSEIKYKTFILANGSERQISCIWDASTVGGGPNYIYGEAARFGTNCPTDRPFNNTTLGECSNSNQKGSPPPMTCTGNPINIAVGNKFQREDDFKSTASPSLSFSRYYNSLDGIWRHEFSTQLRIKTPFIAVIRADGRESIFKVTDGVATATGAERGKLENLGNGWKYSSPENSQFSFDNTGKLTSSTTPQGIRLDLLTQNSQTTVSDGSGNSLTFTEDGDHQPTSLIAPGLQISYAYDTSKRLISVTSTSQGITSARHMHYEDTRNAKLLTGVSDESGVRFATWSYDENGRAISSEHAQGAEKVSLTYNADGSTTVTNEYGKKATYRFQVIQGEKLVTAIEGEATPNCPYSNSAFTYDANGLLKTKTDAKGNLTTYDYNTRGLETSRTEASGTPQARTIATEWHPTLYLKTKVTEPSRITTYQYDAQGRQLGQIVTPR